MAVDLPLGKERHLHLYSSLSSSPSPMILSCPSCPWNIPTALPLPQLLLLQLISVYLFIAYFFWIPDPRRTFVGNLLIKNNLTDLLSKANL